MKNVIYDNAYGILGLLPNATQKEIAKRTKEIEKLLQIGEIPKYEYDFGIFNQKHKENKEQKRTAKTLKEANTELADIKRQISHSFFRVYVSSPKHAEILAYLSPNSDELVKIYQQGEWDFITKKNFAIMLSLILCEFSPNNAEFCIRLWFELLNSPNYLKNFQRLFLSDDELNINETHFEGLKERLMIELSKVFKDIADKHQKSEILTQFISTFGTQNLDESVAKQSFDKISQAISLLDKLDISADGVFDDDEKMALKKCLQIFTEGFDELKRLGLYESAKSLQIRDLVVEKIRKQSSDLHNNLSQSEESLNLTKFATQIAGTEGMKSLLEQELEFLQGKIQDNEIIPHLIELIKLIDDLKNIKNSYSIYGHLDKIKNKFKYLQQKLATQDLSNDLQQALRLETNDNILNTLAIRIRNIAIDLCNEKGQYDTAKALLILALEFANVSTTKEKIRKDLVDIEEVTPNIFKILEKLVVDIISVIIGYGFWFLILFIVLKACS